MSSGNKTNEPAQEETKFELCMMHVLELQKDLNIVIDGIDEKENGMVAREAGRASLEESLKDLVIEKNYDVIGYLVDDREI